MPVFVIGVDPHKGSHTAAVLETSEEVIAECRFDADGRQLGRVLEWAEPFRPRRWAVEGATGPGALLARQLVAAGEQVVDVPSTLTARVRLLDRGRSDKTDAHDARAAAVVALRHANLRTLIAEDHDAVLRLLADRHHDLVASAPGWSAACTPSWPNCEQAELPRPFRPIGPRRTWPQSNLRAPPTSNANESAWSWSTRSPAWRPS